MMDPYKNALAAKDALAPKIAKLEQQLNAARQDYDRAVKFLEAWGHFSGAVKDASPQSTLASPRSLESTVHQNPSKEDVAKSAVEILREAGRPLIRSELHKRLTQKGIDIRGKNPLNTLSTMLYRMETTVRNIPRYGYWPVEDDLPVEFMRSDDLVYDKDYDELL
jgi:hypothetical protein